MQRGPVHAGWRWKGWDKTGPNVFVARVDASMIPEKDFTHTMSRHIRKANQELAKSARKYIDEHWSPEVPSTWGNPPAVRTGKLKRSVRIKSELPTKAGKNMRGEVTLGYYRDYAGTMEVGRLYRPFVSPAVKFLKDTGLFTTVMQKHMNEFRIPGNMRKKPIIFAPSNAVPV